ncbi:aminopeptidase N [Pseudoroseicyclus aestuarii]|uniref:Aminopeptidase N n=1 Tax=Pseudoroseicyclus aestuarii TaxID=1795041 RepID=A0A318SUR0_9RHOB|nr:aminopeptidase N [Pseudoroseicyclus aestuarii]PYE85650.1 aminopeptidase N [Pseudoroseicyclus aestuarii]
MRDAAPQTIYLKDYAPFPWLIDGVELTFRLSPKATRVTSRIRFRPNPDAPSGPFFLNGETMTLLSARIDGAEVQPEITPEGLTCAVPDGPFTFEAEVEIDPEANTSLDGLYRSGGMYCTQCEAQGFRKITFYPDRPDVMAVFTVRVESEMPVLLSNGNPVDQGDGWAEWHDPWPKPAYLFALVAGDLVSVPGHFTTRSGRAVDLNIWVRPGDEGRAGWALESLKLSMRWDEEAYGREYDLDVFNIVAVDDFNMGAMENKGLNIFNSRLVLASPETATDTDFERIEAVIAHEYFHNWTGNRITCRDWFQLCLKEGLTVFRDQSFTSDVRSAPVKRIEDAILLRARQFREDQGPLAHPVRPESFVEINNFYTVTVYEKGAEIVGMLKRLVGDEGYRAALDLYFDRHDGQAVTIEDWLKVFEDATGRDLTQFARWYSQAGTPHLTVTDAFEDGRYTLTFRQETAPTPGQTEKAPQVIPIAVGLLGANGDEVVPTTLLEMTEAEQSFTFEGLTGKPVPSILRGFSAPVEITRESSGAEKAFLLAHDTDPFNRWEAGRDLARATLTAMILEDAAPDAGWLQGLGAVLRDTALDPAFRALVLALPTQDEMAAHLARLGHVPDPLRIRACHRALREAMSEALEDSLPALHEDAQIPGEYSPQAEPAGRRALGNAALGLITLRDGGARARAQFETADNMTQSIAALGALLAIGKGQDQLAAFEARWSHDRLVMDKWFGLQIALAEPEEAAPLTERLTQHPGFDVKNPNRVRAVFGSLSGNAAGFHAPGGASYALLADWLIRLDALNPQTASRLSTAFDSWRRYDETRQGQMRAQLERIAGTDGLSRDLSEMVQRMLG